MNCASSAQITNKKIMFFRLAQILFTHVKKKTCTELFKATLRQAFVIIPN